MKIIEQDSGLWAVYDKTGRYMGAIFDGGWKTAAVRRRRNSLYHALAGWNGWHWHTNIRLGSHRNFMTTLGKLFA